MTKSHATLPAIVFHFDITQEEIDAFFNAVSWSHQARPAVPITFFTRFRDGEFTAIANFGIPLSSVLHGEQGYAYFKEITPGRGFRGETSVKNHHEKISKAGETTSFLVFETDIYDPTNALCVKCSTTIVARVKQ